MTAFPTTITGHQELDIKEHFKNTNIFPTESFLNAFVKEMFCGLSTRYV